MADEPRRSGRSTKGVNLKNQDEPEPPQQQKSKKSTGKKEQQTDEVRCVCGDNTEETDLAFIACELCSAWQHPVCVGLSEHEDELPDLYYCEECKPENHKELLEAMARGEQPWVEAKRLREEAKAKGKKGKRGRASKAKEADAKPNAKSASPATSTPPVSAPAASERGKRKLAVENGADTEQQPAKVRRPSTQDTKETKEKTRESKRKSDISVPDISQATHATPTPAQPIQETPTPAQPIQAPPTPAPPTPATPTQATDPNIIVTTIEELSESNRSKCATFLRTKFDSKIKELDSKGEYRIPDGETSDSTAQSLAIAVEHSMFKNLSGSGPKPDYGGAYKLQMRDIGSNIARNSTLMLRLLTQSVSPDELSKMSSDDMASEELQRTVASMKEASEKQSTLVNNDTQRRLVRRTHKGEELVEDQSHQMTSDSIVSTAPLHRRESNHEAAESPTQQEPRSPNLSMSDSRSSGVGKPLTVDTSQPGPQSPNQHARRSSSNFDIKNVWSSVQSPGNEHTPKFDTKPLQKEPWPTHSQPEQKVKKDDPDIDRLLDDAETDSPPYSPGEATGPPIVWRGLVDMPIVGGSVAKFHATAQHVAGSDLKNKVQELASIYPETLEISGRIQKDTADTYLTSLSASRSTDVSVHSIRPAETDQAHGRAEFDKLFQYFVSRNRYGVVADALHRENVSDMYLIPLEAGSSKVPVFLDRLYHNIIDIPPSRPMLLVVFILKWKPAATPAAGSHSNSTPSVISPPGSVPPPSAGSAMSPLGQPGSQQALGAAPGAPQSQMNSYPPFPSSSGPPADFKDPTQIKNFENAELVLGELAKCPTTLQVLVAHGGNIGLDLFHNMKKIFDREPAAQNDINVFYTHLAHAQGQG